VVLEWGNTAKFLAKRWAQPGSAQFLPNNIYNSVVQLVGGGGGVVKCVTITDAERIANRRRHLMIAVLLIL
jgi:hypothetical protein